MCYNTYMTYLPAFFLSFITGMFLLLPSCVWAHPNLRTAWARASQAARVPARIARMNPVRAWKYPARPMEKHVYFPSTVLPNSAVWDIPLSGALQREYIIAQPFPGPASPVAFPGKQAADAIIFDVDGTLLDSLGAWEHSGSNFVRSQGIEPAEELDEELEALNLTDGARLIQTRYHIDYSLDTIIELTLRPIKAHYYTDIAPMPGVPALLEQLHREGVKMAVATAGDAQLARAALERLGLEHYFEFIITCDEVGAGKTSPAVYEAALQRLGTPKARTWVVEDALHALQTAHAAGFPTVAVDEAHSFHQRAEKKQAATYFVSFY